MWLSFEPLGNAILVFYEGERPVLADRLLTYSEMDAVLAAEYVWISHATRIIHLPLLALLPRSDKILLPTRATDFRQHLPPLPIAENLDREAPLEIVLDVGSIWRQRQIWPGAVRIALASSVH